MAGSLKDQLLKAGFKESKKPASKHKGKKSRPTGKSRNSTATSKRPSRPAESDLARAYRVRQQAEKSEQAKAKREKLKEEARRRKVNDAIGKLVEEHALNSDKAELKRNFMHYGKIRQVLATEEQLKALNSGELGLTYLRGRYYILPADTQKEVAKLSPQHVVDINAGAADTDEAEFPVPDDLIW